MALMGETIDALFSNEFLTRDCCGAWHPVWQWVYVWSHMSIAASYFAIPGVMFLINRLSRRHRPGGVELRHINLNHTQVAVGVFVLFCGIGHLEGAWLSWYIPAYHLFALWHALTAIVSWAALGLLFTQLLRLVERP